MPTPGSSYTTEFLLAADADSLPVATAVRNGVIDLGFVLTVAHIATARYVVAGTIPAAYAPGDVVIVSATATIAGVPGGYVVDRFAIESAVDAAAVDAALLAALSTPATVQSDAGMVQSRSIADLLALRAHAASLVAGRNPGLGLRFTSLSPDGTVEGGRRGAREFNRRGCR